jgi:hypothetical protein
MIGTVLHDGKRSTTETTETAETAETAETGVAATAHGSSAPPAETLHVTHGLVAIANGPDYCLCGHTWPCEKRAD